MSVGLPKRSDAGCGHKFQSKTCQEFQSLPFPTSENIKSAEESISIVKKAVDSVKNLNFKVIDLGSLPQTIKYLVEFI